jgi:hypothetical protein
MYAEQIVISGSLSIIGIATETGRAVIRPTALPEVRPSLLDAAPITAGVIADGGSVVIDDVDLDMSAAGVTGCAPALAGIYFRNTAGRVRDTLIEHVRVAGGPDCESGVAFYVESGAVPAARKLRVASAGNRFRDYQKAGLVANGTSTVVRDMGSEAVGSGLAGGAVQIGFQVAAGATGLLRGSSAHAHASSRAGKTAAGVLVFGAGTVSVQGASIVDGQTGVFVAGDKVRLVRATFANLSDDGVVLLGSSNALSFNTLQAVGLSGVFVNGNGNLVRGGSMANMPVGVWLYGGEKNTVLFTSFDNVTVPLQGAAGGPRDLTAAAVVPFLPICDLDADCDDGSPCTVDTCDPGAGVCSYSPDCGGSSACDGLPCSDGRICSVNDSCLGGVCVGGPLRDCDDADPCTVDGCADAVGCVHWALCNDGNPCTTDLCDSGTATCQAVPVLDGTPCADTDACNGLETCLAAACTPGTPPDCDDGNECTAHACDPAAGCQSTPVADGTPCGTGMTCTGGACL